MTIVGHDIISYLRRQEECSMGRSFVALLNRMARAAARQQRMAEADRRRSVREQQMQAREHERVLLRADKAARQRYLQAREDDAAAAALEVEERVDELSNVLQHTLAIDDTIRFDDLKVYLDFPPFIPSPGMVEPAMPPIRANFGPDDTSSPGFLGGLLPGAKGKHQQAIQQADAAFAVAMTHYERLEKLRLEQLAAARQAYLRTRDGHGSILGARNREVDQLRTSYFAGEPPAIIGYAGMVLERSRYPEGFPQEYRTAYVPESKQLVVDYELPGPGIVPESGDFKYNKTKDEIQAKPRKPAEMRQLFTRKSSPP